MQWIELKLSIGAERLEEVVAVLGRFGQGGVVIEDWEPDSTGEKIFTVKSYLPGSRSVKGTVEEVKECLTRLSPEIHFTQRRLKPQDWFDSLKTHFRVLEVGEKFIIKPSWVSSPLVASDRILIEIDPGAAFGTGLHPTTRLCLLNLERLLKPDMTVMDLGTGSGILSIAAARLGASSILALDNDPVAVNAAYHNVKINHVDRYISLRRGSISLRNQRKYSESFNLVLANISATTISGLAPGLFRILKHGGILIASGIHSQGLDTTLISLALAGFNLKSIDRDGEWHAVTAGKNLP